MGLTHNLLTGIFHLVFVATDFLFWAVVLKVIYDRWHFTWLKKITDTIDPLLTHLTATVRTLTLRLTANHYSEKVLLLILLISLLFIRLTIASLL